MNKTRELGMAIAKALGVDAAKFSRIIIDINARNNEPAIYLVWHEDHMKSELMDVDWPNLLKGIIPKTGSGVLTADPHNVNSESVQDEG